MGQRYILSYNGKEKLRLDEKEIRAFIFGLAYGKWHTEEKLKAQEEI
jgi:hypothetical protein